MYDKQGLLRLEAKTSKLVACVQTPPPLKNTNKKSGRAPPPPPQKNKNKNSGFAPPPPPRFFLEERGRLYTG